MKIAINTRLLIKDRLDGIGWFTYHTTRLMCQNHPEVEFLFIFDRPFDPSFINSPNITPVYSGPPARHPFLYYLWFEHSLPRILKKHDPDILINPDGFMSLSTNIPQIPVIHDLNFEHFPKDLPFFYRHYYKFFFPRFARSAKRIATVSEYSKNDICNLYHVDDNKVDVVYNGVNEIYAPITDEVQTLTRSKVTGGSPYFLFVGSLHPRKNISNMLKAFDRFRKSVSDAYKMVIVGNKKWWTADLEETFNKMENKSDVIFLGRLPVEELKLVSASAFCSLYVSTFEGFGVPIVESMRCGVPVITSNVTSMPEIAGNAALLTDPFDPEGIAQQMLMLTKDQDLRDSLIKKGIIRAEEFSWHRTSSLLWDCVLNSGTKFKNK